MNCHDITSILDDRDFSALSGAEREEAQAHLHACTDCADEWTMQQRLSAAVIPAMPSALAKRCRVMVAAQSNLGADTQGRRRATPLILIGALAAVAAAAALLDVMLRNSSQAPVITAATVQQPPAEPAPMITAAPVETAPAATRAAPVESRKKTEALSDSPRFTVRLLPLQDRTQDESSKLAVKSFYSSLLDGLRRVPGLTLLQADAVPDEIAPSDFYLSVTGDGPVQSKWSVRLMVKASVPVTGNAQGQRATVPRLFQYSSVAVPSCTGSVVDQAVTGCSDPRGGAVNQIELMREVVFPPDPSLRRALQARVLDHALDPVQRFKALESLRASRAVVVPGPTAPRLTQQAQNIDTETLRGALDLAATAGDPLLRKQVWGALRGVRQPDLIQPLIDVLQLEASDPVRLEAVTTLAMDYADDAKARGALESISKNDSQEIVRRVAQRSLSGEASWNDYVTKRLLDAELPDAQRVEPLLYMASVGQGQQIGAMLDAKAVEALSRVVPRMVAGLPLPSATNPTDSVNLPVLIKNIVGANQPASVDLLTGILNQTKDPLIRGMALTGLARHLDDARAREMVENIAAQDADPALREQAKIAQPQLVTPPPGTH
jgi:hypothetical protein